MRNVTDLEYVQYKHMVLEGFPILGFDVHDLTRACPPLFLYAGTFPLTALKTRLVSEARKQLDPVDQLISDAKWDAIRNIIKTSPLADIKV